MPDGPPAQFTWRRVRHIVLHVEGPERIAMEWWRDEAGNTLMRDYFRVESREGVRVWLYREWPRDPELPTRWFCTACSHEQCRRVSQAGRGQRRNPGNLLRLRPMRSLPSRPISRSCAARRIRRNSSSRPLALGLTGIGIADRNSVAGVVRAYHALEEWNEHVRNEKDTRASTCRR